MSELQDHPEYRGLLAAVKATPNDDLPRLVLADWLEEHDAPEWAEFIRAQCEVDRHPHAARIWADTFTDGESVLPHWQAALTSARRVRELWPEVAKAIFAGELDEGQTPYHPWPGTCYFADERRTTLPRYTARRGFLGLVVCPIGRWMGEGHHEPLGPLLVARQPVRQVRLSDRVSDTPRHCWFAVADDDRIDASARNYLPWCVADRLTGHTDVRRLVTQEVLARQWYFPSAQAAFAALSRAAIAWAEAEAGV